MKPKEMNLYKPDAELVDLAKKGGFLVPEFALESPNATHAEFKISEMWLALAKFKHLCQQEEKAKFADAYLKFNNDEIYSKGKSNKWYLKNQ